ncbi:sulfur carrier protein ThiS [Ammoniphilus sp. CFH 90114]|uniref:sulfur carrier protein ThiS n=1 Tax=Ammoniphilus sp. CFH 90114 TaxID=2493665 RepID=UPI00100E25D8|nr:sulfur carrier protein ThiS [Ammoniphilus sp. CFH 90114]RXT05684.1 thiamine biosynthesis protein ThiS [Ammoniphilus sp. CFH 90114]
MKLHINGEEIQVPDAVSYVTDLIQHFGLENKVLIIELNTNILQKEEHARTQLSDGDRVEIVHFVGGG